MNLRLAMTAVVLAVSGCAQWSRPISDSQLLAPAQMSPDSVVIEVAFVRLAGEQNTLEADLWQQADEQSLSVDVRRRLDANGFRVGLLGQLPDGLRTRIDSDNGASSSERPPPADGSVEKQIGPEDPLVCRQQRFQCRSGRRAVVMATRDRRDNLAVLEKRDGKVRGDAYQQAQCLFGTQTTPLGTGRTRLELTPEIEHGVAKQKWVGDEGTFRLETRRESKVFAELRWQVELSPGQILLVGATPETRGLGQHFFTETSGRGTERQLILIRVVQTQLDDLFQPRLAIAGS